VPASARIEDLLAQFAYDKAAGLQLKESVAAASGSVAVSDLEYANGRGGVAKATLFVPAVQAKRPAILMSPGSNQSRVEMRDEALRYAALGIVVLVVDQSQIAAGREKIWTLTPDDREEAIESVIDLLRGVDVLSARADVDMTRIGIYGFSYGASLAALAGAADLRVSLLVLRSGGPQILREIAGPARAASASFAPYLEVMSSVDQLRFAAAIPVSAQVLVQNGSADTTYPADGVRAWQAAVGGTKVARMYDGLGHTLGPSANDDALAFVRDRWQLR
jgi:dienelactone hydrolase